MQRLYYDQRTFANRKKESLKQMAKYTRFDPRNKRKGSNQTKDVDRLHRQVKTTWDDDRRSQKPNPRDIYDEDDDMVI